MTISMPRGDIRRVRFTVTNTDGTASSIDFSEIYFTVKKTYDDRQFLFQKKLSDGTIESEGDGAYSFTIMPEDTNNLKVCKYVFDIELIFENEIKQTTVGDLVLTNEVTYASNEG